MSTTTSAAPVIACAGPHPSLASTPVAAEPIDDAIEASYLIINKCFETFDPEQIGISFNGGKDSVVMLYLAKEAIGMDRLRKMKLFMFAEADEFEEMVAFRAGLLDSLGLELRMMPQQLGIKGGLQQLHDEDGLKAVILGTRADDPDGRYQESAIKKCSAGWPDITRYCPVFDWHYKQVWSYILNRQLPYCILYHDGFTSLGSKITTQRNSHLAASSGSETKADATITTNGSVAATNGDMKNMFRPAWELEDGKFEREGRGKVSSHC